MMDVYIGFVLFATGFLFGVLIFDIYRGTKRERPQK